MRSIDWILLAGIADVEANYVAHCRAAREIAFEEFDDRKVLPMTIEAAMQAI